MQDKRNPAEYVMALSATLSGTTEAEGEWIDVQDFDSLTFIVSTGTVTDAGTTSGFAFEVEDGDDTTDAGATPVADADLIGVESDLTVTADTDDNKVIGTIGYRGTKRYVRMTATGTTGTNAVVSVVGILADGRMQHTATVGTTSAAT